MNLDRMTTEEVLRLINREDQKVGVAVSFEIPQITAVVDDLVQRIQSGGRLIYVGAGTSGRMGVIDAAECPPTFGTAPTLVQAIIAGGPEAVFAAQEGAEDSPESGADAIDSLGITKRDMVIGIAASKRTPFVLGALERAHVLNASTVLVTTNPRTSIDMRCLTHAICPETGPEVLMGSTRMKSAVAQKMILTMITTTAMVKLGKVYENMMVDLKLTNQKLRERAKRIIMLATDCDQPRAEELLALSRDHVKTAIVMQLKRLNRDDAEKLLSDHNGFVREALK